MKDRTEFLYPSNCADGPVIPLSAWIPPKEIVEVFNGFKIFKSAPADSPSKIVQYAVTHPAIPGDMLRVDNYKDGSFAANWFSTVDIPDFLNAAEKFFQEFEDQFEGEIHGRMGVFTSWRDPEFWEFGRPLTMVDLKRDGVFIGDEQHPLGLLRLDTPPGDICLEPKDESIGIIAY